MPLLKPSLYDTLQIFINRDYSTNFRLFQDQLGFQKVDTVIDVGCGTGLMSHRFTEKGVQYVGIDPSNERISVARIRNPKARFFCGNIQDCDSWGNLDFKFVIMQGVIHHLSNVEFASIKEFLKSKGCHYLGSWDPMLPEKKWKHPLATLLCKMDDGKFVRTEEEYKALHKDAIFLKTSIHKWNNWPVKNLIMTAKLIS